MRLAVVVVSLATLGSIACSAAPDAAPSIARQGAPAPRLTLPVLDGGTANLDADRGKVVLINFWATWCEPCKSEMPALQTLADELRDRPFRLYSVDLQEDPQTISDYLKQLNLHLYVLLDEDGAATRTYGVRGLPATFLVDQQGIVRIQRLGPLLPGGAEIMWSEPWLADQVRGMLSS
jgi:thiol-disulfide isomerase/thioredoxin